MQADLPLILSFTQFDLRKLLKGLIFTIYIGSSQTNIGYKHIYRLLNYVRLLIGLILVAFSNASNLFNFAPHVLCSRKLLWIFCVLFYD